MKAFDADVLTLIAEGNLDCTQKAALIPGAEQCVPINVAEQWLRGRLNTIRKAEAGKSKVTIDRAYDLLERTIVYLHSSECCPTLRRQKPSRSHGGNRRFVPASQTCVSPLFALFILRP